MTDRPLMLSAVPNGCSYQHIINTIDYCLKDREKLCRYHIEGDTCWLKDHDTYGQFQDIWVQLPDDIIPDAHGQYTDIVGCYHDTPVEVPGLTGWFCRRCGKPCHRLGGAV